MENTCKQDFGLTLSGQIVRMETLVGEVKQLVESLTAENKMLKERLAKYEPEYEKYYNRSEYCAPDSPHVYLMADRVDVRTTEDYLDDKSPEFKDPVFIPAERDCPIDVLVREYTHRILVNPKNPQVIARGQLFTVNGKLYFHEDWHNNNFKYPIVSLLSDIATADTNKKVKNGIAL